MNCTDSFTYMLTVTLSCAGFGYTEKSAVEKTLSSSLQTVPVKFCERGLLVPQPLLAFTVTVPVPVPQVTSMFEVVCPAVMVPLETVQLLVAAGVTAATLKLTNPPLQNDPGKAEIVPGIFGFPINEIVLGALFPGEHAVVLATTVN